MQTSPFTLPSTLSPRERRARLARVIGGALAGERVAVDNGCELVLLLDDADARLRAIDAARAHAQHVLGLTRLLRRLAPGDDAAPVDPRWKRLRRDFSAAVGRGDLPAALLVQTLLLPTLGGVLYGRLATQPSVATLARWPRCCATARRVSPA